MTEEIQVTIEEIDDKSPHLQTVITLGDANKATVGFFPEGAFRKRAKLRQIIVALVPQEGCIGYLLYRPSYERITIVHLCVASSHQGKGVARLLVNYLNSITQEYSGIGLHCRRDYKLDKMWSKLGFVAKYEKPAKTRGKLLTFWWLDHGHPNLLSIAANQLSESKLFVVIDSKVFLELYTDEDTDSEESKSLLADWLQPYLELCITNEIINQINFISNDKERNRQRKFSETFICLSIQNQSFEQVCQSLEAFLKAKDIAIDEYDVRHLARTIASDVHIFVTRDIRLLALVDELYDSFRLSVIRPTDLIIQLDELRRKPEYQPSRLAGTDLRQTAVPSGEVSIFNDYFQSYKQGETKAEFQQRLRRFIAEPDKFESLVVVEGENKALALVVYDRHKRHELEIPMFRVGDNPLAPTIAHHLLFQAASLSAREQRQFTRITDPRLQEVVITSIHKDTFVNVKNGWLRANIAVAETASQLSTRLFDLANNLGEEYDFCRKIANTLSTDGATQDIKTMLDIERWLYPTKIIDVDIPTFIIPIKPFWAQQLFDAKLANQTLIGATKTELALNREAVYYKSKNAPKKLKPGLTGRILWYVSDDNDHGYNGVSAVRACSRLDEVVIGKPKELYRRFRNLGIYEERNVLDEAQNNLDKDIMAIRFSDTELFNKPIPLKKIKEVLDKKVTMQAACYISIENFAKIYTLGIHT